MTIADNKRAVTIAKKIFTENFDQYYVQNGVVYGVKFQPQIRNGGTHIAGVSTTNAPILKVADCAGCNPANYHHLSLVVKRINGEDV